MRRGTLEQYNIDHNKDCLEAKLPIIGYVNGIAAPNNQHTIALYDAFQNPDGSDDYAWKYIYDDLLNLGWIDYE